MNYCCSTRKLSKSVEYFDLFSISNTFYLVKASRVEWAGNKYGVLMTTASKPNCLAQIQRKRFLCFNRTIVHRFYWRGLIARHLSAQSAGVRMSSSARSCENTLKQSTYTIKFDFNQCVALCDSRTPRRPAVYIKYIDCMASIVSSVL
jgi:hypothetical protein